ncbi:hypothetical protein [Brachyspira pilosicoli]|uniref:hypothetical protein n=1 Tax=Brachyspira pilosicoli TaxID=52584 RepID=UPI001CA57329|nr:hypothetical protein [Brachyspira pilosicoli]MBW5397033.1 hypothetical protein [Brachyspira pilosicoli]
MKEKNKNNIKIKEKLKTPKIVEKIDYKYICLQHCNIDDKIKGREKDILKTLKDFSSNEKLQSRNIHPLNKDDKLKHYFQILKMYESDKLYSVDIEGRNSKFRMLFCKSKIDRVYKILSLCTDETH